MPELLSEFDEPEAVDALESVFDKPLVPIEKRKQQRDESYRKLAADTRALTYRQRLFIRALLGCGMNISAACRKLKVTDQKVSRETATRWMTDKSFRSIIERYTELACAQAGVSSPAATVLRINAVVENALEPVPMYHNGLPLMNPETGTIQKEVDRGSALKGLEMIGKYNGAFRKDEENSQRVTVVLDFSGDAMQGEQESELIERNDAIDADFAEVTK